MDKEVLTKVTFKENCEYESSTISKKVPIPQQTVLVNLMTPINKESNREENTFYYNDKIELQAVVFQTYGANNEQKTYIETGRIEFYFIPEDSTVPQLINKSPESCQLNQYGVASVYFKPNASGRFFAKYIDNNDFYTSISPTNPKGRSEEVSIHLTEIPINISFDNTPSYIANVHDEVTIKVHVTHAKDNTDIQYGTVTFLHYLDIDNNNNPNKPVPKIIGNPVPLDENGCAEIHYIPVQTDDDLEPENDNGERYIEYIKAVYNYTGKYIDTDKEIYKWKYYQTVSKWTSINVLISNSINIGGLPSYDTNTNVYYHSQHETVALTATLVDKNGYQINFSQHSGDLTFHIRGVHIHPKTSPMYSFVVPSFSTDINQTSQYFNFIPYEEDITASFTDNQFIAEITLLPGSYTVTATTDIQIDTNSPLPLIDYEETENDVMDTKKYAQVTNSNNINIHTLYGHSPCQMTIECENRFIRPQTKLNVKGYIRGLSKNEMMVIDNQVCLFRTDTGQYQGVWTYDNNENILIAIPSEDIVFNNNDDTHWVLVQIPTDGDVIYTNNINTTSYHHDVHSPNDNIYDCMLSGNNSDKINISVRDTTELELSIPQSTLVGAPFTYSLLGKYLGEEITVQLKKRKTTQSNDTVIKTIALSQQNYKNTGTIAINEIGEYEISATYNNISATSTVSIEKANLTQELLQSSKTIFASPNNTIGVYLHSNYNNINNIDINNIHAYLYDENQSNEQEIDIQNTEKINNTTIYLTIRPGIDIESDWYIKITYDSDWYTNQYNGILEKFTTELNEPGISLTPIDDNRYNVSIGGKYPILDENYIITEVIFGKIINNKSEEVARGIYIDKGDGYGSIYSNESWWDEWDFVVFIMNSSDSTLLDILSNNTNPYNALKTQYQYIFDENNIATTTKLYTQVQRNQNQKIFNGYKEQPIGMSRLIG